jgi:hypothetical protein
MRECLKERIKKLETNSKNMNIKELCKGILEFKKAQERIMRTVRGDYGDLLLTI